MEVLCNSDIYRIIHKQLKENGVKIDVDTVRNVLETYSNLCYTCLSNGVRINLPNLGEFYRNVHKGRKEGYYNEMKTCLPCAEGCLTCFNQKECVTCNSTYFIIEGEEKICKPCLIKIWCGVKSGCHKHLTGVLLHFIRFLELKRS